MGVLHRTQPPYSITTMMPQCRMLKAASIHRPWFSPLMRDFNHPDTWRGNTAKYRQSRRFLESFDDPFLTQVVEDSTRNSVLLNLVLRTRKILIGHVKAVNYPR